MNAFSHIMRDFLSFHGNLDYVYSDLLGMIQAVYSHLIATTYRRYMHGDTFAVDAMIPLIAFSCSLGLTL